MASVGTPQEARAPRTISWRHCALGLVVGEAVLLLVANLGSLAANAAFGPSGAQHADGGIVGVSTLLAVILGGWLAARTAGRFGLYQGIVVAIGFIVWGAIFQFLQEAQVVAGSISAGGHTLVDLGAMDMGSLITGDLLALFGGSVGGLLSGKK
ncbi:MAG: hypothetical protein JO198_07695 [Candidatus Dormibacteraeota bacterium]|nr:hypothetical protein [Candidatus Dormibacteraeota bacterium]